MVTKDINSGLLSKMAKFVLNPTTNWSELDKPEPVPDAGYSKLALKEMIERKRQNDFVRRREFDYLRKLRRNGLPTSTDGAGRPSFFQSSSTTNMDERATTIKKIDEIEAHMSKQWWRKQDEDAVLAVVVAPPVADISQVIADDPLAYETTQSADFSSEIEPGQGADYQPTQMGLSMPGDPFHMDQAPQAKAFKELRNKNTETGISGFTISKLFSIEMGDGLADPELEEAAIRFANGDDVGAEEGLLAALQTDNINSDSVDGWAAALFDLYRATGQQISFDRVAIDYAERFGRSAPAWFSTPDLLGRKTADVHVGHASSGEKIGQPVWMCPPSLDFQSIQSLREGLSKTPMPWQLNWSQLNVITPQAAKALAELFAQWCSTPVKLQFFGADALEKTLRSATPSGDKKIDSFWWQLRLDALRLLRLQDEFELAALDYCVTYEVSPPPWIDARCEFVRERGDSRAAYESSYDMLDGSACDESDDSRMDPTAHIGLEPMPTAVIELSGEVLGDAAEALGKLQDGLRGADRLVISCARLIRVDFSAAGSILNWVAVRQAEGCQVQFHNVPRLVAAFFNVIGISEHARVEVRIT